MKLNLTCHGNTAGVPMVLLSGWGLGTAVWQPCIDALTQTGIQVLSVELPGYDGGDSTASDWQLPTLAAALRQTVPVPAFWCGWSMGGMLAAEVGCRYPEAVLGLISVASNPRFVACADWPRAMAVSEFAAFAQGLAQNAGATLSRFQALCVKGSDTAREDLRKLKALSAAVPNTHATALNHSLALLAGMDQRQTLREFEPPQLHIIAERDALVPPALAPALLGLNPAAQILSLAGAPHAAMLSHSEPLVAAMLSFIAGQTGSMPAPAHACL